jgi:putative component of membrane protein insertase Oxa1/YidC/SpoIIIJ protein YidD/TM2 domain-containing membrane protein YozV
LQILNITEQLLQERYCFYQKRSCFLLNCSEIRFNSLFRDFYHIIKGFFFFLILLISANSASQNLTDLISFANQLAEIRNFSSAIQEYRRAYFFAPDSEKFAIANKIADCYISENNLKGAKAFCDSAILYSISDSARTESYLKKITCIILDKQFGDALVALNKIHFNFNLHLQTKKNILTGITYLGLYDYKNAYTFFIQAIDKNDSIMVEKINRIFSLTNKIQQPNPLLAGGMSMILPGSGQMYAGQLIEGINSLALLAGITYLGISLPPLQILFSSLLMRYYMGGFTRAYRYALEKREIHRQEFSNNVISLFPGNEAHLKNNIRVNEFNEFRKQVFDSDKEFPMLISGAFLFYKRILSAQDVDACVFTPSCSVYMMETIKKHGLIKGIIDGTDRLLRCHGFANHKHYEICKTTGKFYDAP